MEIHLHFSFLLWKVFKKSKIAQIYYYDPQSAGINLQSPQSDSTPWTLTLVFTDFLLRIPPPDVEVKAVVVEVEATEKYKKKYTKQLIKYPLHIC